MNTFFSPNGRMGSAAFIRAGFILILAGTFLGLTKLINPTLGAVAGLLSAFLIYPWVCIWVKRLHNGDKSGSTIFVYIAIYAAIFFVLFSAVIFGFSGSEFMELVNAKQSGEISQTEYFQRSQGLGEKLTLPATIAGILASLAALFIGDKSIPNDLEDNQYGAVPPIGF